MKQSAKYCAPRALRTLRRTVCLAAAAVAFLLLPLASSNSWAGENGPDKVFALVGNHPITEQEVDAKVAPQLYDLRKKALDHLIDDYLVGQAARRAGLKPDDYVDRQVKASTPRVTEAEAQQFYTQHKAEIDAHSGAHSFAQISGRLMAALQQQQDRQGQERLISKLRSQQKIKVMLQVPRVRVASAGHPSIGPANAPVTIVEFGDFQCPFCRAAESSLKLVRQKYGDQLKLVFLDFPLNFHAHAMDAARAARCAADQHKFWQYHDALFADQKKLSPDDLKQTAAKLGLDPKGFDSCFASNAHDAGIRKDIAEGRSLGITGTPTFFINGRELVGAQPTGEFTEVIDEELVRARGSAARREARATY